MAKQPPYQYYFGREGSRDLLPALAAFGRLDRREGDDFTADYMRILNHMCKQLRNQDKRHKHKRRKHWTL